VRSALALALLAGCRGFETPTPEDLSRLLGSLPPEESSFVRLKVRMKIDSPSLAGEFEGVVVARTRPRPAVRAQFFPDLGGKALDLVATADRITGYFPFQNEGIDLSLPGEARLHPLTLIGVTLLEHAAELVADRVTGVREEEDGRWYRVAGAAPGVTVLFQRRGERTLRRFTWRYGVGWTETSTASGAAVEAPGLSIRVDVLSREHPAGVPERIFELALPPEVRR
jgi:hypothetical protein